MFSVEEKSTNNLLETIKVMKVSFNFPKSMSPTSWTINLISSLLLGCLIVLGLIKMVIKRVSFFIAIFSVVTFASLILSCTVFESRLEIVVPKGFHGKVCLVLSNVNKNILNLDSNGIGYIDRKTYDKTYAKPIVKETDGTDITDQCVGWTNSTFWARGTYSSAIPGVKVNKKIYCLDFEIVPIDKKGQRQDYFIDLEELVDTAIIYKE